MYITDRMFASYTKVTQMKNASVCTCFVSVFFNVAIEWE